MSACQGHGKLERLTRGLTLAGAEVMGWLRGLRQPGSFLTAGVVVAAGALEEFNVTGWPHTGWWDSGLPEKVFVPVIAAATILSFLVIVAYSLTLGRLHDYERFAALAEGTARVVERETSLGRDDFSVNIFRVQGPCGFRRLEQVARVAPDSSDSAMLWTKGKGVIGFAWAQRRSKYADLEALQVLLATEELFCQIPRDNRFRFSWNEFEDTRKYTAVLAVPIRPHVYARYPVRGVLAVAALTSTNRGQLDGVQNHRDFADIVSTAKAILSRRHD
ncbi:MAG TPA: hypothetical protein VH063_06555 [Gaiellaceae bacterium]|jgi:hypothetical protein|nr:hypothetical protein [Gaiellaceae bacterium]